jgi:hypothetical protein
MAKHTPGPWEAMSYGEIYASDGHTSSVATVLMNKYGPANARLIAAAPDMLAALQCMVAHAPDAQAGRLDHFNEAVEVCRAAIAKAVSPRRNEERADSAR